MMCFLLACICLIAPPSPQDTKVELFTRWGTSPAIPMVSFGLPTEQEIKEVQAIAQRLEQQLVKASSTKLSEHERSMEMPFLLGMLDGMQLSVKPELASSCIKHLAEIGDSTKGIGASRVWRMRLQAFDELGFGNETQKALRALQLIEDPDPEDVAVGTLYQIKVAFNEGDYRVARYWYDQLDESLRTSSTNQVRIAFACGYAKYAPSTSEALYSFFQLGESFASEGGSQKFVDSVIHSLINRLPRPPVLHEHSEDARIAHLAKRFAIRDAIEKGELEVVVTKLIELARDGEVNAAEQLLSFHDKTFSDPYVDEAILIVLANPEACAVDHAYWRIFAANHCAGLGQYERALQHLAYIDPTSSYFSNARQLQQQLQSMDLVSILEKIKRSSPEQIPQTVSRLIAQFPQSMPSIASQCIQLWHREGIQLNPWILQTTSTLASTTGVIPIGQQAELHRLLGDVDRASICFQQAIRKNGNTLQYLAGLSDCTKDASGMRSVQRASSPTGESAYWYWLAQLRLLEWHLESGGDEQGVIAKVNRLRKKDASLGGANFISRFNTLCTAN